MKKRLAKLEQAVPSMAEVQAHDAAWREAFKEFGLPPDTPVPAYLPIVIRAVINADGKASEEFLSVNGQYVGRR